MKNEIDIVDVFEETNFAQTGPKDIPLEVLIEFSKKGLSGSQIAKIVGCNKSNVNSRLRKAGIHHLKHFKKNRADVFASLQSKLLNSIKDSDIDKTPMGSRVTAAAILYDKERLERDKSTENIATIHSDIAALKAAAMEEISGA